jgi:3-methyladenine DNA glycosylase AlkD
MLRSRWSLWASPNFHLRYRYGENVIYARTLSEENLPPKRAKLGVSLKAKRKTCGSLPRTALRYAIEKIPKALKEKAMEK